MAVYTNDLRLKEIANGDESGTWGTSTNLNLKLIGESLSFQTEAVFDADGDKTTTVADGAEDPARGLFYKATSTTDLTATRVLTIGPATISRVMFIENATSGSQSITVRQSAGGTNVTIANGQTKAVYLDGAASNPNVVDAFQDLSIPDLFIDDDLTFTSDSAVITFGADGDTTLTHTDGSGLTLNSTNKLMFNDASQFIQGSSATVLSLGATDEIDLTATAIDINGTVDMSSTLTVGGNVTINSTTLTLSGNFPQLFFEDTHGSDLDAYIVNNANGLFIGKTNSPSSSNDILSIDLSTKKVTFDAGIVVNESGGDNNTRFEGDSNTSLFEIDASADKIGVGTSAPSGLFHVYNGMLQVGSKTGDTSVQQNTNAIRIAAVPNSSTEWGGLQWYREFSDYIGAEIIAARASSTESDTDLIFKTSTSAANATERFRVAHSGEIQIGGTTNAGFIDFDGNKLQLNTFRNPNTGTFVNTGKSHASIVLNGSDGGSKIQFYTDDGNNTVASERVTIDTEGRVGVGDTTPTTGSLAVAGVLSLEPGGPVAIDASNSRPNLARSADGELRVAAGKDSSGFITFHVTPSGSTNVMERFKMADNITFTGRSGTSPIFSLVNVDTEDVNTGRETSIRFSGFRSGGESVDNAQISGNHVGRADDDKGGMIFYTNGGSGLGERMRIDNAGIVFNEDGGDQDFRVESDTDTACFFVDAGNNTVCFGSSSPQQAARFFTTVGTSKPGYLTQNLTTGSTNNVAQFMSNGESVIGTINATNTATAYNTSSDYRLKENVETLKDGLDRLNQLKPVQFTWTTDGSLSEGFIAHEVEDLFPDAVSGEKDAVDEEGNIDPQQVDYGRITPLLVKAIQEQQEQIEELKAEVAKLKGE